MSDISQVRVNNTDYNFSDDTKVPYDLLKDTVGWTGKNLLIYPYGMSTGSNNGITYTDNGDGTWTLNGTATATSNRLLFGRDNLNEFARKITSFANEDVIISDGLNRNDVWIQFWHNNGGIIGSSKESDAKSQFTIPVIDVANSENWNVSLMVANGTVLNNVVVKPMLRKADIMDSTYEPYNPSVKQVLRNNKIIEGKNLLKYPYHGTTGTKSGITFTVNTDGSVTVNGTATAQCTFLLDDGDFHINNLLKYKGQQLIITGCPSGGSNTTYSILVQGLMQDGIGVHDYGNGVSVTPVDFSGFTSTRQICIMIRNGVTVNNLVFKPMVRLATETDPTYEPYYPVGVVSQKVQNVLGAKNLIIYPYYQTTRTENGITFTDNGDGTIKVTGTATANCTFVLDNKQMELSEKDLLIGKKVIGSGCPTGGSTDGKYFLSFMGLKTDGVGEIDTGNGVEFIVSDYSSFSSVQIYIGIRNGYACPSNGLVFKPMLRLADIKDDTWVPYARTNRELTDLLVKKTLSVTFKDSSVFSTIHEQKFVGYGNLVQFFLDVTVASNDIASWTQLVKFSNSNIKISGNLGCTLRNVTDTAYYTPAFNVDNDNYILMSQLLTANKRYQLSGIFIY